MAQQPLSPTFTGFEAFERRDVKKLWRAALIEDDRTKVIYIYGVSTWVLARQAAIVHFKVSMDHHSFRNGSIYEVSALPQDAVVIVPTEDGNVRFRAKTPLDLMNLEGLDRMAVVRTNDLGVEWDEWFRQWLEARKESRDVPEVVLNALKRHWFSNADPVKCFEFEEDEEAPDVTKTVP